MDDFAIYNGKKVDLRDKMKHIVEGMKDISEFQGMVSMPRFKDPVDISKIPRTETLASFVSKAIGKAPEFEPTAFHDPFFIAYSHVVHQKLSTTPVCLGSNWNALQIRP